MQIYTQDKRTLALYAAVALAFLGSYTLFFLYKPQNIIQPEQVKGEQTSYTSSVPYPAGSRELSVDQTDGTRQTTLQTTKSPEEVASFYTYFFSRNGWKTQDSTSSSAQQILKYKLDKKSISIAISKPLNLSDTVVVISEN